MGRTKILLAEDQSTGAADLHDRLKSMGYTVAAVVSSGEEALKVAAQTKPDLALVDVNLDGKLDGITAAQQIRRNLDIPVVFLLASADKKTLKRAEAAGPFGHVAKPFEPGQIHAAVEIALYKHSMERKLRRSEERYRNLYDQSPTINVVIGPDGIISDVNKSFQEVLGYKREEAIGRHTLEFIAPHHSGKVAELLRWARDGNYVPEVDLDIYAKDGSLHTLLFSLGRALSEDQNDDRDGGRLIIGLDITDRRQAQQDLRRNEQRLRAIFDAAQDAIFIKDQDLKYVLANPATAGLFGLDQANLLGRSDEELFDPEHAAELRKTDTLALTGQVLTEEHQLPVGEQVRTFEITRAPIYDGAGHPVGLCGIARDVTQRKQAEMEKHLMERRLHEARRLEGIGQLAGGIANHFNNFLTVIQGNAQLLKLQREDDQELTSALDQILTASRRSEQLIRQLLAYACRGPDHTCEMDINTVIEMSVDLLHPNLDSRTDVKLDLKAKSTAMIGDAAQLETALLNLGLNSRDAMPNGGQITFATNELTLDTKWCEGHPGDCKPGRYLQISVTDNGIGMDKETLDRVFEPFFTTKGIDKAVGMGLASVYACVRDHQGAVEILSEVGSGTTVSIFLPLDERAPADSPQQ